MKRQNHKKFTGLILYLLLFCIILVNYSCKDCKQDGTPTSSVSTEKSDGSDSGLPPGLSPEDANKVLARIGSVIITVGDLTKEINRRSPIQRKIYSSPEKRKEMLNEMIRLEVLAQEAEKRGYGEDPEVKLIEKQLLVRELEKSLMDSIKMNDITDNEAKRYYDDHYDEYHTPEQVRVYHILLSTKAEADKILKMVREKLTDERYFRELAQQYSTDEETKQMGGNLGYISPPGKKSQGEKQLPAELIDAAFKLSIEDPISSEPVKTSLGFHIIRLSHKRPARDLTFDDMKQHIIRIVYNEKVNKARDDLLDKLRKNATIEINEANLAKIKVNPVTDDHAVPPFLRPNAEKSEQRPPESSSPNNP